jgi:hypothetical protein
VDIILKMYRAIQSSTTILMDVVGDAIWNRNVNKIS